MQRGRILVPLDGSMLAEGALSNAVDLAEKNGATMPIVRADHTPLDVPSGARKAERASHV
jgi:nucleotide-binding universal stress UspA family protein